MAAIPKFSIRQMLLAMIVVAVFSAIAAGAFRGNSIALGLVVGVVALIVPIVVLTIGYWLAYSLAVVLQIYYFSKKGKPIIGWLLVGIGLAGFSQSAAAQGLAMPPGKSGYVVTVDNQYPDASVGYRPVRVTVATKPLLPVKIDTLFNVVIQDGNYNRSETVLTAKLILAVGQSSASIELYYPNDLTGGSRYGMIIVERGAGNERLEPGRDLFYQPMQYTNNNSGDQPATLWVASTISQNNGSRTECWDRNQSTPTIEKFKFELGATTEMKPVALSELSRCYPDTTSDTIYTVAPNAAPDPMQVSVMIHGCHPAELPQHWIGLSSVQRIFVSRDDLKTISVNHELQRDSLEKWVAAGGSLVVYDVGEKLSDADDLLPLLLGRQRTTEIGRAKRKWLRAGDELVDIDGLISSAIADGGYGQNYENDKSNSKIIMLHGVPVELDESAAWQDVGSAEDLKNELKYVQASYVNGRIFAIGGTLEKWRKPDWIELENAISLSGDSLSNQLGSLVSSTGTSGFSVPGVGQPPLVAFQILIGLFILIAGPLMFGVLRKTRRLQLLFLLVPMLSLSACLGLLAFAIFVDGFGAWGRVQSVTWLDQPSQSAVTHARAAYYRGLQPQPYSYLLDTVTGLPENENEGSNLKIHRSPEALSFSGRNMRARTPHQVVNVRSFQLPHKLIWLPPRDRAVGNAPNQEEPIAESKAESTAESKADPIEHSTKDWGSFRNQLGAKVLFAAARTETGLVSVDNLPDQKILPAQAIDGAIISERLFQLSISLSPRNESRYNQRYGYNVNFVQDGINSSTSTENRLIERLRVRDGAELLDQPNTYLAILETFPAIDKQIEAVNYKQQLHVIIGKW